MSETKDEQSKIEAPLEEKTQSIVENAMVAVTQPPITTPPITFTRNQFGLIDNGSVSYAFTPDGLVDWRKMINPKYLVPNKQRFIDRKQEVPKTIEGLEDKDLLILLQGIKELAQLRGYECVIPTATSPNENYVVATCSITWIGNYETEGRVVTFGDIGDASLQNTNSFGRSYLGPIAANRAFVRAVRNFLRINIVGQDEVATSTLTSDAEQMDVSGDLLTQTMQEHGVTWEKLQAKLVKEGYEEAKALNGAHELPKVKQFEIIQRIKKKAKENAKTAKKSP